MEVTSYFKDQLGTLRIFPHAYFENPKDKEVVLVISEHDMDRLDRSIPLRTALGKIFHLKPERLEYELRHVDSDNYEMIVSNVMFPEEG